MIVLGTGKECSVESERSCVGGRFWHDPIFLYERRQIFEHGLCQPPPSDPLFLLLFLHLFSFSFILP